jgi:PAS domain S-box-containing protein
VTGRGPAGPLAFPEGLRACQALSGEIVLENLIDTFMVLALEHAGADRGVLVLPRDEGLAIEAEAARVRDTVEVRLRHDGVTPQALPRSLLDRVVRSRDGVHLEDASIPGEFSADPYFARARPGSVLCVPLLKQDDLIGALYLEAAAPHGFAPSAIAFLALLASQAALSLENARRYEDLERKNLEHARAEEALQDGGETLRKQAEALLAAEKRLLEMIARGDPLSGILEVLCRFVEERTIDSACSVLLVAPGGRRLTYGAAPNLPDSYTRPMEGAAIGYGAGPCATAAMLKEPVIVSDFETDGRWSGEFRTRALAHGLRACWSTPILSSDGRLLGTFAVSSRAPGGPTPPQQALVEQFTHIASIAIERDQAEVALQRSEACLAEAQRLTHTGSFRWCPETEEITWSEETYRIYGIETSVTPTMALAFERVHPEDRPLVRRIAEGAARGGEGLAFEHRLLMPDGSVRHVQVMAHPLKDASGRTVEFVGAVLDVTQRKRSEEALHGVREELAHVARVATLGELTASIAHEVNQPLSGIMANASTCLRLLAATPPDLEEARETARRTLRDGQRAGDVIARLRSMFRKKGTSNETVDMNEAIREVIALTRHEVQKNRILLSTELAPGLPRIGGDRVQLQQVVLNLILNAVEAMSGVDERPRDMVIQTRREDPDRIRVVVRDAGVGLEPRAGERIFEAFHTTKTGGMGMGLSIARSIVENHGGRLWAASDDGPGATFFFSLPARVPDPPRDPPSHTKA